MMVLLCNKVMLLSRGNGGTPVDWADAFLFLQPLVEHTSVMNRPPRRWSRPHWKEVIVDDFMEGQSNQNFKMAQTSF